MIQILQKLKNPTVLVSVLTQIVALLILMGVNIDENAAVGIIGMVVAILGTLGVISKNQVLPKGLETAMLTCASTGDEQLHVKVNGQMVCTKCGTVHVPSPEPGGDPEA